MEAMNQYGIRQLFSISLDNASNNNRAIRELKERHDLPMVCRGRFFHVRCACHIFNFAVKAGMDVCGLNDHISKIRYVLNTLRTNKRMKDRYTGFCSG